MDATPISVADAYAITDAEIIPNYVASKEEF